MGDTCRMRRSNLVVVMVVSTLYLLRRHDVIAATLPNCSFPAIYSFGDSLTDVGNGIAVFPDQFAHSELEPYGVSFPLHAADRFSDGHLVVDFFGEWSHDGMNRFLPTNSYTAHDYIT